VVLLRNEFPCRRVEDESPEPDGLLTALELQMDAGAEDADRPVLVLDEPVQPKSAVVMVAVGLVRVDRKLG
jgi:hypothetical protein